MSQLLRGFVDSFSELRIEVLELIDAGDQVIAPTVLHGRMRNSGTEVNDRYVFVFAVREGLIVEGLGVPDEGASPRSRGAVRARRSRRVLIRLLPAF
jgi:ketosteroid isomerase-like protein